MRIPIVNENDEVIGDEERSIVHQKGILHREVHVWFINPESKIIFQKRGIDKETFPGLLDATAGGHVDLGQTYEQAAIREAFEETGIEILPNKLIFIENHQSKTIDEKRNLINNKFISIYAFVYKGLLKDLIVEGQEALGFQEYSIQDLENLSEDKKQEFIPKLISPEWINLYKKIILKINETQS